MIITWIARIIASLNANRRAGEIGAGVAMGSLLSGIGLPVPLLLLSVRFSRSREWQKRYRGSFASR
ncbi:MAG: hypothetical protein ACLFPW_12240 [Spirochaetaceae bacterium]